MAANVASAELVAADDGGETITDIQNYLQSFNKEIGEHGGGDGATFYTIDASQLADGASAATGTPTTVAATGTTDGSGYQTVAIVPDGSSGGYVLIVQPQGTPGGQVQVAGGGQVLTTVVEKENTPAAPATRASGRGKKGKQAAAAAAAEAAAAAAAAEQELEKPNDISVYDFDDGEFFASATLFVRPRNNNIYVLCLRVLQSTHRTRRSKVATKTRRKKKMTKSSKTTRTWKRKPRRPCVLESAARSRAARARRQS